ncbi:MAG: sigma-70 family RNA polymerase sigma factor, partial [Chitinophagaceae bacterium]
WDKRNELIEGQSLKPLLYTIVRNKSLNWLKKKKIEITDMEMGFEVASDQISAIDLLQAKETEKQIQYLINKLPPKCQQIFVLSRREYLSNKEIASVLDISEKTVENQITIAIRFIRNNLQMPPKGQSLTIVFPWVLAMLLN